MLPLTVFEKSLDAGLEFVPETPRQGIFSFLPRTVQEKVVIRKSMTDKIKAVF
jgi:hypothetical protein